MGSGRSHPDRGTEGEPGNEHGLVCACGSAGEWEPVDLRRQTGPEYKTLLERWEEEENKRGGVDRALQMIRRKVMCKSTSRIRGKIAGVRRMRKTRKGTKKRTSRRKTGRICMTCLVLLD